MFCDNQKIIDVNDQLQTGQVLSQYDYILNDKNPRDDKIILKNHVSVWKDLYYEIE